eukprot:1391535-Amorphochlora_amoeboformis.AAC.2
MASSRVWVVVVMGFVGTIGSDSVDVDDCVLSLKSPPIDTNFHLTTRVANHRPDFEHPRVLRLEIFEDSCTGPFED